MRTRGLAGATTKEIAKAAGYSEAALYKHFRDKTDLVLAVLSERIPSPPATLLATLERGAGVGDLEATLTEVARAAIAFCRHGFPMAASLFAEPKLLAAYREALRARDAGPQHVTRVPRGRTGARPHPAERRPAGARGAPRRGMLAARLPGPLH